jgi:hypothetical protein
MNPKPGFLWLYFIWAGLLFIMIYYVVCIDVVMIHDATDTA